MCVYSLASDLLLYRSFFCMINADYMILLSISRSGSLNGDGEGSWPVDPSQDVEVYKLLYEIANTVERYPISSLYNPVSVDCLSALLPSRHADGLFTSGYSKLLGQLSAKEYLESLLSKRSIERLFALF
uniref:Glucagon / GIP / secretin / VIP family domain-containing protein n=1 Tax=Astyanax mexicanus TaxID=7994 RepID=A0A8B9JHE2_ASTMX